MLALASSLLGEAQLTPPSMAVQIPLEAPIGVYVDTDEPSFCHTFSATPHPGSSISEIPSGSWEESVFVASLC